jgi:hypothetical protein
VILHPARKGPQEVRVEERHVAADDERKFVSRRLQPGVQAAQHAHTAEAILDQWGT